MDAILALASCISYTLAKAPIWGIDHVVLALIQIILFALDFLAFSVAVGWMALDGVALLLDTGYHIVTMTSSAAPTIVAALWTTLSSPKEFANLVRKFSKTVTANVPYFVFLTIDIVENLFMVAALIFKAIIITRALPLAVKAFRSCFSSAIAPVRSAKWRRTAKRNFLAFGFQIVLAICGLVALLSQINPFSKTVTANVPYFVFLTIDTVENVFMVAALIFKDLIITRAFPLAVKAFRSCFSSAIAPVRPAKWRRTAKRNFLAFGFPILLAICGLVALLSQINPTLTERRMASGVLSREPGALFKLTGMLLRSDDFNLSWDVVINYTHMNLQCEAGIGGWSIPTLLLDNASNQWLLR